ncbi:MAG: hypothetical protein ACTHM0_06130 [Sphingomonas sp.]
MAGTGAVKLEAPPPRQRVIERDGRLVVIDSAAPLPTALGQTTPARRAGRWFERTSFDGRGVLTTRSWYDLKGPRRLQLDPGSARIARLAPLVIFILTLAAIGGAVFFPWLLVVIPALIQPKPWKKLRGRITERLDRFPAATQ